TLDVFVLDRHRSPSSGRCRARASVALRHRLRSECTVRPPRGVSRGDRTRHPRASSLAAPGHARTYNRRMIEFVAQRLMLGDVVLIDLPDQQRVEATVVRHIERTERTVRVPLRVEGQVDFIREWPLGEMVTVVHGS